MAPVVVYFLIMFVYLLVAWNWVDPTPSAAMGQKQEIPGTPAEHVSNQVLVSLKAKLSKKDREKIWETWKLSEVEQIGDSPLFLLEYKGKDKSDKIDIPELVKSLEKHPQVKYAEPNMIMKTFSNGS